MPILDNIKSIDGKAKDKAKAGSDLASHAEIQQRVSVTDKTVERPAITKEWILDKLRENAEKGLALPGGSVVANRALELLGKEFGMFQDPADKPMRTVRSVTDLSLEELDALLGEALSGEDAGSIQ